MQLGPVVDRPLDAGLRRQRRAGNSSTILPATAWTAAADLYRRGLKFFHGRRDTFAAEQTLAVASAKANSAVF